MKINEINIERSDLIDSSQAPALSQSTHVPDELSALTPAKPTTVSKLERRIEKQQDQLEQAAKDLKTEQEAHAVMKVKLADAEDDVKQTGALVVELAEQRDALKAFRDNEQVDLMIKLQARIRMLENELDTNERMRYVAQNEIVRLHKVEARYKRLSEKPRTAT